MRKTSAASSAPMPSSTAAARCEPGPGGLVSGEPAAGVAASATARLLGLLIGGHPSAQEVRGSARIRLRQLPRALAHGALAVGERRQSGLLLRLTAERRL